MKVSLQDRNFPSLVRTFAETFYHPSNYSVYVSPPLPTYLQHCASHLLYFPSQFIWRLLIMGPSASQKSSPATQKITSLWRKRHWLQLIRASLPQVCPPFWEQPFLQAYSGQPLEHSFHGGMWAPSLLASGEIVGDSSFPETPDLIGNWSCLHLIEKAKKVYTIGPASNLPGKQPNQVPKEGQNGNEKEKQLQCFKLYINKTLLAHNVQTVPGQMFLSLPSSHLLLKP